MRKELIIVKKSKLKSKKLEKRNDENNLVETKFDNENLLIITEPRKLLIKTSINGEECTTNEHYPQRKRVRKITETVKKKDDLSTTYKRGEIVYYKAHPEAEPEILAVNGLAIWNYNEFLADIDFEGIPHRIFYNQISNKFIANEIVSYDFHGTVLLKNPANPEASKICERELLKIPENQWLDTIKELRFKFLKRKKHLRLEKTKKPKGRPKKNNLRLAALWCVKALDNKEYKNRNEAIREAYKEYGEKDVPLKSFARTVGVKIKEITDLYNKKPQDYRTKNTRASFAEEFYFDKTSVNTTRKRKK